MKNRILIVGFVVLLAGMGEAGVTLSYNSELYGTGNWASSSSTFTYEVTPGVGFYHYKYILNVAAQDVSHLIIEVSGGFTQNDIWNVNGNGLAFTYKEETEEYEEDENVFLIGSWATSLTDKPNPYMPEDIFGIKFDGLTPDSTTWTIEFDSKRVPVYGDFYAVDGKKPQTSTFNALWNLGFTSPDEETPANLHILRPDTFSVPAPGALLLGSMGIGLVGWLRRRNGI